MTFGESLRKERELRGITLDEISQHTKVHPRFLEAIEHDDLSVLPAKAFAKGFLRSYAKVVGLDEDEVIANFEYRHRTLQIQEEAEKPSKRVTPASDNTAFIILVLLVAVLAVIVWFSTQQYWPFNWF